MLQDILIEDTMSNLTSASNEASISSSNNKTKEICANTMYSQQQNQSFVSANNQTRPPLSKKKRNLPGNPDPEAEVVALSPKTLMATNRFVCEICNKGFQRDQNLQLHRRGHNLPWKLKTKSNKEVKRKVYVCPEPSCAHHDPSRALGDLTGIKKHFCRKHGEKKWKCEKCSKRYAVQSDWKAHSKICGTREYRCDCGTLFSRRDSFITHRAFCDALAEENSKSMTQNQLFASQTAPNQAEINGFHHLLTPFKPQNQTFNLPPWLSAETGAPGPTRSSTNLPRPEHLIRENPNPSNISITFPSSSSSLMSATALLQKATQMGVTMSTKIPSQSLESILSRPHHHMGAPGYCAATLSSSTAGLPSREDIGTRLVHGLSSFGDKAANVTSGCMELQDVNMVDFSLPAISGFNGSSSGFVDNFSGMLNTKMNSDFGENRHLMSAGKNGSGGDGLTRDFLGLTAFPHTDFLDIAGLDQMGSSSYDQKPQSQAQWHA